MSDPLSITASLVAVLQLSATAIQYLKDIKDGLSDRRRLRDEVRNAACLLEMLRDRIDDSEDGNNDELKPASISSLVAPDGPLHRFKEILEDIVSKLVPQARLKKLAQSFTWPFEKSNIAEVLTELERLKMHFSLIMQNDLV
jgi:hypothetical protein